MAPRVPRDTTTRDRHRQAIARKKPPCALCGKAIDYSLRYPDPMSFVVDHIIPVDAGGPDTIENKQAAHRSCNRTKSNRVGDTETRNFVTLRAW